MRSAIPSIAKTSLGTVAQPCKVPCLRSLMHTHLLKEFSYNGSSSSLQSSNFTMVSHITSHHCRQQVLANLLALQNPLDLLS